MARKAMGGGGGDEGMKWDIPLEFVHELWILKEHHFSKRLVL